MAKRKRFKKRRVISNSVLISGTNEVIIDIAPKGDNNMILVSEKRIEELSGKNELCISEKLKRFGIVIDEAVFEKSVECIEDTKGEVRMIYITVIGEKTAQKMERILSTFYLSRSDQLTKNEKIVLRTEGKAESLIPLLKEAGMKVFYQKDLLDQ